MISGPLALTTRFVTSVSRNHDYRARLAVTGESEIATLCEGINSLLERIGDRDTKLQESEAFMRAILETAADGIITIDTQGIMQTVNHSAARIFGYEVEVRCPHFLYQRL